MNNQSGIRPNFVEVANIGGRTTFFINIDIEQSNEMFDYQSIKVEYNKWNYAGVVDALISYKYPIDKMQATINNYLLDPNDDYAVSEFHKMQEWRKEAKEIAKEALLYELH